MIKEYVFAENSESGAGQYKLTLSVIEYRALCFAIKLAVDRVSQSSGDAFVDTIKALYREMI